MAVAQSSNLLYRSASSLRAVDSPDALITLCRLEIGDTAGWKPALQCGGRSDNVWQAGRPCGSRRKRTSAERRPVKKRKKKVALARRQWQITRYTGEAVEYSVSRVKSETRDESEQ